MAKSKGRPAPKKQTKRKVKSTKNQRSFTPPSLESPKRDVRELIEEKKKQFHHARKVRDTRHWMEFKVNVDGPIAIPFIGDPHIDDKGCNWPLLIKHAELMQAHKALFPVGLGDYTNNWTGYLQQKKSPHEKTTREEAWQLAEWLFGAIDFQLLIKGNHDLWSKSNGTGDPLDWMVGKKPMLDWQARFQLRFPNDRVLKIWVSHDFKGHSMWNPNHGPMKKERMTGSMADIYVAGDKHNWIITRYENADTNRSPVMARARGYKYIDSYAEELGYDPQEYGATITCVIDPENDTPDWIMPFASVQAGLNYLEKIRNDKRKRKTS